MEHEVNEKACFLDMPNGLEKGIRYGQKFVKAPESKHPHHESSHGRKCSYEESMRATLGHGK